MGGLIKLLFILGVCTHWTNSEGVCRRGFVQLGQWCYGYFHSPMKWMDAENSCKAVGAILAEPRDHAQNIYVDGMVYDDGEVSSMLWLGGHDMVTQGQWEWASNGDLISDGYDNWGPNEPNGGKHEDCLALWNGKRKWIDISCFNNYTFVCQYEAPEGGVIVG